MIQSNSTIQYNSTIRFNSILLQVKEPTLALGTRVCASAVPGLNSIVELNSIKLTSLIRLN